MKRVLSVFLALCLIVCAVPMAASAAKEDFTVENGVITAYSGPGGAIAIPEDAEAGDALSVGDEAFRGNQTITGVSIKNTSLIPSAFEGCTGLKEVTLGENVAGLGERAFAGCTSLTSVTFYKSIQTIAAEAFDGCSQLTDVYYAGSQEDWGKVQISEAGNQTLSSAQIHYNAFIPQGNCGQDVVWGFAGNTLVLRGTGAVSDYSEGGGPWNNTDEIRSCTEVVVSEGITSIGKFALNLSGGELKKITLPHSLEKIGENALSYMGLPTDERVIEIPIPAGVKIIEKYAFNKGRVPEILIPEGVTSIGKGAFAACSMAEKLSLPSTVTSIGEDCFNCCNKLTEVTVPGGLKTLGSKVFSYCNGLKRAVVQNGVTAIRSNAFVGCSKLTDVVLPKTLTTLEKAFPDSANLKNVYFGGTKAQWENLVKGQTGLIPAGATVHFDYSGSELNGGSPNPSESPTPTPSFSDLPSDPEFVKAINWAVEKGVTKGTGGGKFSPEKGCTRGEIVTFLWRAMGRPEASTSANFTDMPKDGDFVKAINWAVESGVTKGKGKNRFMPNAVCTREEAVTFIWRAYGKEEASADSSFSDMPTEPDFVKAINWAVENGVTKGTGGGKFSPKQVCKRGQIVTFIYRAQS